MIIKKMSEIRRCDFCDPEVFKQNPGPWHWARECIICGRDACDRHATRVGPFMYAEAEVCRECADADPQDPDLVEMRLLSEEYDRTKKDFERIRDKHTQYQKMFRGRFEALRNRIKEGKAA